MSTLFKRYDVSTINDGQLVKGEQVTFLAEFTEKQVKVRVAQSLQRHPDSVLLSNPVIVELV